jgi:hypothetical protein
VAKLGITIDSSLFSLSSAQVIMIVWGGIICWANILETITYNEVECKKPFRLMFWKDRKLQLGKKRLIPEGIVGVTSKKMRRTYPLQTCSIEPHQREEIIPNDDALNQIIDLIDNLPD